VAAGRLEGYLRGGVGVCLGDREGEGEFAAWRYLGQIGIVLIL
jgi:hypothetical protein